jgi:ferritin-like metal-binding protein YciE
VNPKRQKQINVRAPARSSLRALPNQNSAKSARGKDPIQPLPDQPVSLNPGKLLSMKIDGAGDSFCRGVPVETSVGVTGVAFGSVKPRPQAPARRLLNVPSTRLGQEKHPMEMNDLQDLFIDNLKDLYSAEKQMLRSMPKLAKAVESEELKAALQKHAQETEQQVRRLEQIFERLGTSPRGKKCKGMEGLIEENKELLEEDAEPEVLDAGIIVGAQKVEHYEIAGYGSAVTFAKLLGDQESAKLLAQTLDEEERTDKLLTQIAESSINVQAAQGA